MQIFTSSYAFPNFSMFGIEVGIVVMILKKLFYKKYF